MRSVSELEARVWVVAICLLMCLAGTPVALAQGSGEKLAMPFLCRVEQGHVEVTPGPEQIYDVVDRREQQFFTACFGRAPGQCRNWNLQRFSISCHGQRVRWIDLMVAAAGFTPFNVRLAAGHLYVSSRVAGPQRLMRDCYDRLAGAPSSRSPAERDAVVAECWQGGWRPGRTMDVELPAGFAPLGPLHARIIPSAAGNVISGDGKAAAGVTVRRLTPATGAGANPGAPAAAAPASPVEGGNRAEPRIASGQVPAPAPGVEREAGLVVIAVPETPATKSAVEDAASAAPPPAPALRASQAEPVVTPSNSAATVPVTAVPQVPEASGGPAADTRTTSDAGGDLLEVTLVGVGAALVTLVALIGLVSRRRGRSGELVRQEPNFGPAPDGDATMAALLLSGARDRLDEIRALIDTLPATAPLRQVLSKELRTSERRIDGLAAEQPPPGRGWQRHRSRLQAAAQDLNRLRDIATSASQTVNAGHGGGGSAMLEPKDRSEAYAVLGINADADEGTLKKVVDALRRAWHPDLAKDDADRERREQRIKQINVAWDLIQGRRAAG
jgi:hypothetical protein